ncbi:MAG TPA: hypothetical protein VKY73_11255 [Polyangiaceae bacterium]|nr:hypothetical protein [Polyangiaceae bacterium]
MADKQTMLRRAVPVLLNRLIAPLCVDANGQSLGTTVDANGACAAGEPEFSPIRDIHIGVISSSLGAIGPENCQPGTPRRDDAAHLLGTPGLRPDDGLISWNNQGFLAWDPDAGLTPPRPRHDPPGMADAAALITAFQNMVSAVGEDGCGYEATLEAWYRFLIDPVPPQRVAQEGSFTVRVGFDETVLAQRAAFLRPDSLLAIVMLTDENDCSIADWGQGHIVSAGVSNGRLPRATSACEVSPDDPCCSSCALPAAEGCTPPEADPACADIYHDDISDYPGLRCFDQKRRFGFDYLQPIERYVRGLTDRWIYQDDRDGDGVFTEADAYENPLYKAPPGKAPRDRSLVFLAGIVGVPWQDVADEESWSDPTRLRYLSYEELTEQGRWEWILAPSGGTPKDALMVETPRDRTTIAGLNQTHPALGVSLVPSSVTAFTHPINGHESIIADGSDLQYACLFELEEARPCVGGDASCDCTEKEQQYNRGLCDGTTQTHGKAYPGTRQLEVLRRVGAITGNAIVASICPKVTRSQSPATDPAYGYNPAIAALVDRLKVSLRGRCLPRPLDVDPVTQRVPCVVVEAEPPDPSGACVPCSERSGRTDAKDSVRRIVAQELAGSGFCGGDAGTSCDDMCLCELQQFEGADLERCQSGAELPPQPAGYCYVDGERGGAQAALVSKCPATERRLLRFSPEVPANGATAFIACAGKTPHGPQAGP